ncbi:type II toxin-antitoxin system VapC family toxin [Singulisphaera rosea]
MRYACVNRCSPASYWEIAIKIRLQKYALPEPYLVFMEREIAANDLHILAIEPRYAAILTTMPFHHKDPFDRLQIAQALAESIPIVGADVIFDNCGINRIWQSTISTNQNNFTKI